MDFPLIFPDRARLNKNVPKTAIYAHSSPTKRQKELFVAQVDSITWAYKLSTETANLPQGETVKELQVFNVQLKGRDLDEEVLNVVDRSIPSPILYVIRGQGEVEYASAYKRQSRSDRSELVISKPFFSGRFPEGSTAQPMPVALNLEALYHRLLENLIGLARRPGETMDHLVERAERVASLKREAALLNVKIDRERQFNRKVDMNRELKSLIKKIEENCRE